MAKKKEKVSFASKLLTVTGNPYAAIASDVDEDTQTLSFIDTGSYAFNALVSGKMRGGGMPSNKIIALAGESSTGKTFYALGLIHHFLEANEGSIAILYESEGNLVPNDPLTMETLVNHGVDPSRLIIIPVRTIETFRTQMSKQLDMISQTPVDERPKVIMVLDSLGQLSTEKEVEDIKTGTNKKDMTRPGLIRGTFRALSIELSQLEIPMIITNHTYAVVGAYVPIQELAGGGGLKYAASIIVFLSKSKEKDGTDVVGVNLKATLAKGRFTKENKKVVTQLNYSTGLDRYAGLVELAIEAGIWSESGKKILLDDGVTEVFGKSIRKNPTKYFTDSVMDSLEEYVTKEFKYGKAAIEVEELDEEVEVEEEE